MIDTLSKLLDEEIEKAIDNGEDLTQPSNRTIFLKKFLDKHKDNKIVPNDIKSIRPTANRYFEKKLGKENLEMKKPSHKTTKYNSKLASEIAARTTEKKSGIKDETRTETKKDETAKDQTNQSEEIPIKYNHWDAMGVGALFQAMLMPLRAAWPEMEGLNDEEKQALGEMFLPGFQRYGDEKLQFLILPAIGAIGILTPKIVKGRKLHKEAEEKKKNKKQDDKLSLEEETRINKLTCKWCNEMFNSAHIAGHEMTCKKRINQ